ncbi:MAG: nucleotide exchange factor GrpE [Dongiaceae bacterium]
MDQERDRASGADQGGPGRPAPETPPTSEAEAVPEAGGDPQAETAEALAQARAEAAQLKDQLLRALAETENVRRRAQRDREDAGKYAISDFARELLGVADNLRRAIEAIPAEALAADEALKNLAAGVELTERQLVAAFEKAKLRRIDPMGERFDSNLHQAMFEVPGTGQPAGTVVQVLQPGWVLHERLLRPAMVGIAKAGPAPS